MPEAVIHPTTEELHAFGLGKLPDHAAAAVAAHLESCTTCRHVVAGVTADSFLNKVRAARQDSPSFALSSAGQPLRPDGSIPNLPPELTHHAKYHIIRELGRGGMGVVYQARHKEMERQVVIKVINRALLDRPDSLERFRREIWAAAQLSHPNIVTAYDAEQVGELHMLVMEFVPGRNLTEVVHLKGPLPISVACHFARQVAFGLQEAYECGMVHRDIKPQNLMLTREGQVKILDFGLAKLVREERRNTALTSEHAYLGTPDYCAPEQATDASKADIRADLYSLGCTLYYLLSGRPPFREDTLVKTILAHQQKQPQPLPELRPEVPVELWHVIVRLLDKDPAQRYEKPIEVAQALVPFLKSGAKQVVKDVLASTHVSSPKKGTMIAAETSESRRSIRKVPGTTPSKVPPAEDEAVSPFADPPDTDSASKNMLRASEAAEPCPVSWWRRPGLLAIGISVSLVLILLTVIIKVKTPERLGGIADQPAKSEFELVRAKLMERNPGFDGDLKPKFDENGLITGLWFLTDHVTDLRPLRELPQLKSLICRGSASDSGKLVDLSPLQGMRLTYLDCYGNRISNLSPLEGMPLEQLHCLCNPVADLSPIKGMRLTQLWLWGWKGSDLSTLKGMQLTDLNCGLSEVEDLSPLRGMPLKYLCLNSTPVSDLSPLKGIPLERLEAQSTRVSDLSPLKGMKLTLLRVGKSRVTDLTPIRDMPLTELTCDFQPVRHMEILRSIKTLKMINFKPSALFWEEADGPKRDQL